jgi:hypothetical protein
MKTTQPAKAFFCAILLISGIALCLEGCKKDDSLPMPTKTMKQLYADAIDDAMVSLKSEIIDTLWAINKQNPHLSWKTIHGKEYLLMATFMKYPASYPVGDSVTNTWGVTWLFIPDQMKQRLTPFFREQSDTIERLCQLLGLPPAGKGSDTHIAEVWVPTSRLFRPAGDPSITTTTTPGHLISTTTDDYDTWFNNNIIYSYYAPLGPSGHHYPWTRLGYTYDWAPGSSHVGLSEYVLDDSSGIWVEEDETAADFFK